MALADEIIALAPGSSEYEGIRSRAVAGDTDALLRYMWAAVWRTIRTDKRFKRRQAITAFKTMVETLPIKVTLDG